MYLRHYYDTQKQIGLPEYIIEPNEVFRATTNPARRWWQGITSAQIMELEEVPRLGVLIVEVSHMSLFGAKISCLAMLILLLCAPRLRAQNCRAASDSSYDMIEMVKSYALATDSIGKAVRDSLRIPAASSASGVVLITKAATCKSANAAYKAAATGATTTLSGRIFVVQVGTRYVVWDPAYRIIPAHPADVYMVFDSQWRLLRKF